MAVAGTRYETLQIQTVTLSSRKFLTGDKNGHPVTITGELRVPPNAVGRFPAAVLVHGSGGVGRREQRWAEELNKIGLASLTLDSFSARGIRSTVAENTLSFLAMVMDSYRALEALASHPAIDRERIALMGFSKGGSVALYSSLERFQRMHAAAEVGFAAYVSFYPGCTTRYLEEEHVARRPIRIFHGTADDWTPIEPCREYVARLRRAGRDVRLTEYEGARHGFDRSELAEIRQVRRARNLSACALRERSDGRIINGRTGRPLRSDDPCVRRGTTIGYHPRAHAEALAAVREFFVTEFKLR